MNLTQFALIQGLGIAFIFKIGFLIILGLLEIFLIVVLVQIRSMNALITQPDLFPFLQLFVILLQISVIALFLASLVIL